MLRRLGALAVALLLWQAIATVLNSSIVPAPVDCFVAAVDAVKDGSLLKNVKASLGRVAVGYVVAAILGVVLGAISGVTATIGLAFRDVLELLRPIPPIAWVPIAILWFGLGDSSAWFVVFLGHDSAEIRKG